MRAWSLLALATLAVGLAACRAPEPQVAPAGSPGNTGATAASGAAPAAPPPRTAMRLGLNALSASITPIWLAKDEGIFDKYGFEVELITLQSSSQVAKVMASGEMPVAVSAAAGV